MGVEMYRYIGRNKFGRAIWQCLRGTNGLEGFDRHIKELLRRHRASPHLALCLIMEFITRWNQDRATHLLGREPFLRDCYNQATIEEINRINRQIYGVDYFDVLNTAQFADTGETFGIKRENGRLPDDIYFVTESDSDDDEQSAQGDSNDGNHDQHDEEYDPLTQLHQRTTSMRWQSQRQFHSPNAAVFRDFHPQNVPVFRHEKKVFHDLRDKLFATVGKIDYDTFAYSWNQIVAEEDRKRDLTPTRSHVIMMFRKTASQLKNFDEKALERDNNQVLLERSKETRERLRSVIQTFSLQPPLTIASPDQPLPPQREFQLQQMAGNVPQWLLGARVVSRSDQLPISQDGLGHRVGVSEGGPPLFTAHVPQQEQDLPPELQVLKNKLVFAAKDPKRKKDVRRPQVCKDCGHFKQIGHLQHSHTNSSVCTVTDQTIRIQSPNECPQCLKLQTSINKLFNEFGRTPGRGVWANAGNTSIWLVGLLVLVPVPVLVLVMVLVLVLVVVLVVVVVVVVMMMVGVGMAIVMMMLVVIVIVLVLVCIMVQDVSFFMPHIDVVYVGNSSAIFAARMSMVSHTSVLHAWSNQRVRQ
jgi:hypothetical protein